MIAMMIEVPESHITTLDETSVFELRKLNLQDEQRYKKIQGEKDLCYYRLSGDNTQIETSYYIGINWIVEKHIPIYIRPKLNTQQCEIDYLSMLMEALEETENVYHLDGLLTIDFNKPAISISQREDILSPFLIVQYLQILKIIVRKGLKKAYYLRQDNLDSKIKGKVEFKNVSFGYDKDKTIIHNFSFTALPGQKIAIVGPTGAGKTTLVNLLMRFYEIDSGEILVDGVNIHDMTRSYARNLFGMVLQDTWLFEGTIRDNLKFGNPNATDKEMIEACKMANVHHFITTLPGNYDMVLKEDSLVSQGQKQLLTIARAMIQNSPMLILDEATSSVDTRTEVLIQSAMDRLTKGRTSFVIAHRLSTIRNADQIIVMANGEVVEHGKHDELLAKGGFYASLYASQFDENQQAKE